MNMPVSPVLEPDDLLRMADGEHYELVNGIPVEKPMGAESGEIGAILTVILGGYILEHNLGRIYDGQTGFKCFPADPGLVRKPDFSFIAAGKFAGGRSPKGDLTIPPDLAAEVVSPNDKYEEVEAKVADYRSAGVKLIWVISPGSKTILIRRLDGTCAEVNEHGELSGEDVVPGFACKAARLFV
jgi:Uma2 family endonuclease